MNSLPTEQLHRGAAMARYNQIKSLLPELVNGKTHEELKEEIRARDNRNGAHYVDGMKLPFIVSRSNLDALKTFEVRDDDVFLVTFPRSGKISHDFVWY